MRTRIRVAVVVALVLVPLVLWAQYQPWAVQWLQRANTADNGRNYLGVSSSLATSNLVWVTSNALYSIGASAYVKKAGDIMSGPLTNQIVDPSYLDNLVISNLTVIAGGLGWNGTTNVFDKYGLLMRIPFYPLISFEQTGQATHPALPAQVLRYGDNLYYGTFYNSFLFSDLVTFGGITKGTSFWAFSDAYFRSNSITLQTNFSGYSVASSGFYGNGAGLTNIPIANITTPGAIVTNGMSSSTTLSNGLVMYGGSNFIAQAHPNTGLLVTNGANYVTITNGAIRTSGSVVAGGQGTFSSTVRGSSFHMSDNVNFYQSSSGVGGVRDGNLANFSKWIWGSTSTNIAFTFPTAVSVPTLTIMDSSSGQANLNLSGTLTATNGVVQMVKPSFTTNFTCTTNLQTYLCNGTNQVVTLPNAANVPNVVYRFASTNGWGSFILTNATGAQTIRDGVSLSHKQIGITPLNVMSDGSAWWFMSKDQIVNPNAQFSTSTNITLTAANTAYPVTFNSIDFNNSQGIALGAGTNGLASKMWITNSGEYMFSPSIVMSFGGNNYVRYWFRSNGTNIPNSCTPVRGQNNTVRVVTVPFLVSVTQPTAFEIWAESDSTTESLLAQAASGNYPAAPSVICPVMRISDTWP